MHETTDMLYSLTDDQIREELHRRTLNRKAKGAIGDNMARQAGYSSGAGAAPPTSSPGADVKFGVQADPTTGALSFSADNPYYREGQGQSADQWNRSLADVEHEKEYWLKTALDTFIELPSQARANAVHERMLAFHEAWLQGRKRVLG